MKISLKQLSITISILIILVACIDFFILNEYWMETIYFIGIISLMTVNIVRHFSNRIQKMFWLLILIYVSILAVAVYSFSMLLMFSFGFGYTGREVPWNHLFAIVLNVLLMIITIVEFGRNAKRK